MSLILHSSFNGDIYSNEVEFIHHHIPIIYLAQYKKGPAFQNEHHLGMDLVSRFGSTLVRLFVRLHQIALKYYWYIPPNKKLIFS